MHFPTPYEYENVLTGNQQRCLITVEITDYCESLNSFWCYEDKTRRQSEVVEQHDTETPKQTLNIFLIITASYIVWIT